MHHVLAIGYRIEPKDVGVVLDTSMAVGNSCTSWVRAASVNAGG